MRTPAGLLVFSVLVTVVLSFQPSAMQSKGDVSPHKDVALTRDIKIIRAQAHGSADECIAWAERNKLVVAMAVLDWGGNLIESHAMEGAAANADRHGAAQGEAALRWRPTSETNKLVRSGENLAPTFMDDFPQPGALPIVLNGQVIGAMGVSSADGEVRTSRHRCRVQGTGGDRRTLGQTLICRHQGV